MDLCRLAGLKSAGVLCELTNPDGTMARLPEVQRYGAEHGLSVLTIDALALWRRESEAGTALGLPVGPGTSREPLALLGGAAD